jgi:LmbE family N-acetylglucosaminyl deacetylase
MNVLAIGAHPDDVEFGCAGTLAKHIDNGDSVTVVVMSSSTVLDAHTRETLRDATTSVKEANEAAELLGITPIIGPFQDTKIPFDGESVGFLEKVIKNNNIDIIYTHWSGDTHQDHLATLNAAMAAGRLVPNFLLYEQVPIPRITHTHPSVNYYVDITDYMTTKELVCLAHRSQVNKFKEKQGMNIIDNLKAQAAYRGSQSGCTYAEGFHVLKLVK